MKLKKLLIWIVVIAALVGFVLLITRDKKESYLEYYAGYDLTQDIEGIGRSDSYANYLLDHEDAAYASQGVAIDVCNYAEATDVEIKKDFEGYSEALYTGIDSMVTWKVNVPETGFYNLKLTYFPVESRGVEIERYLYVNGKLPFSGADTLAFPRIYTDAGPVVKDNRGNDVRPSQIEYYRWMTSYIKDQLGYIVEPYCFYFEKGENTIGLEAINEPMIIGALELTPVNNDRTYAEYLANTPGNKATGEGLTFSEQIQGESAQYRSDASLYPRYDKSVPNTVPYSVTSTILNYIGADAWKMPGQWIEWEFEVPEDGYYNITIKGRQNYQRGGVSARSVYIDDEIPFEEVGQVGFSFSNQWEMKTLADEEGTPYRFYLTKGAHRIRLEATLGDMGEILNSLQDSVYNMNAIYRKILVLTGASPDSFRDYNIDIVYPDAIQGMELEMRRLYKIIDDSIEITGQKSDKIATALTLAVQMGRFIEDADKIPKEFASYKESIASLGTSIQQLAEIKLDIDYILVTGEDAEIPEDGANFWQKTWHEIKAFFATFVVDYDAVGSVYDDDEEVVEVWLVTGRDQAEITKNMVDDTFTPASGIKVNVKLIDAGSLLNACIAGNGPDVVLTTDGQNPVNYALRNAVEDLSQFPDYEEVLDWFYPSAYTPYLFDGGLYALPETQLYNVMFYRQDVLDEIGVEVPQTWDDLIAILPTIQGNNMSVAIPTMDRMVGNALNPDLSLYYTMIAQAGGYVYDKDGRHTLIDSEAGIQAFKMYTSLFNDYGLPRAYDFVSRFRSGEMPLGIVDYNTYNTLVVSAPEIRGLWDFTLIPGTPVLDEEGNFTYDEDGNMVIDRTVHSWGNCCMMIKQDEEDEQIKKNAWEFMKWWVSCDTQVRFGRELEAVMGSSARHPTANKEAFLQLSWSAEQLDVLEVQRSYTRGLEEIAGGYYTGRHITNAVRKVLNEHQEPRETLLDYTRTINEEIVKKRAEYGLPND